MPSTLFPPRLQDADLRSTVIEGEEAEQHAAGRPHEQRLCTRSLHRRQPAALRRESGVADRVDPAVKAVQEAGGDAPRDRGLRQPAREQLVQREHAVLLCRSPRDECVHFHSICGGRSTHSPRVAPGA
jgi:hypothetical protein